MADLKTNIELDDKRFERAAKRVAKNTQSMGKTMQRTIGVDAGKSMDQLVSKFTTVDYTIQLMMRGLRGVAGAVSSYREEFPGLTRNINAVDEATAKFQRSLGRDLALAIDSIAGLLSGLIDTVDEIRVGMSDLLAGALGADVEGVNEAIAQAERMDDQMRQRQVLVDMQRKATDLLRSTEEDRFRAAGDYIEAENVALERRMQAIADEARARKQAIQEQELNAAAHAQAVAIIDSESLAKRVLAQRQYTRAIEEEERNRAEAAERAAKEAADAAEREAERMRANAEEARREEERRANAAIGLEDAQRQRAIEIAMLEGRTRAAELAQLELRFARERREIQKDELLTEQQKADALASLARDQERITTLTKQRAQSEREVRTMGVVGGTLGGSRAQAQQLGVRAQERTADATARTARSVDRVVDQMERVMRMLGNVGQTTFA